MEILIFLLVAIIAILVFTINSRLKSNSEQNNSNYIELNRNLNRVLQKVDYLEKKFTEVPKFDLKEAIHEEIEEAEPIIEKEETLNVPLDTEPSYLESILEEYEEETKTVEEQIVTEPLVEEDVAEEPFVQPITPQKETEPKQKKQTFFEKNPDLEKFIGENLINKIGIVILVLGLGFLVKYAIDKNWINEVGRVAIGILSASLLIGLAHKLRKNYKSFSSVLIGGGLALLYFTISLAFHTEGYPLYQEQTITFVILVLITAFAVLLSITYNRIEIAILALFGGFGSPFMVSTGSGNYLVLFSYLSVLNVGMLVLSYYKKWRLVNIIAFVLTMLLFAAWLIGELFNGDYDHFKGAIFFATGFYFIFFLMNILYNLKNNKAFKVGDISLVLSNTFIYFSFMMIMLSHINNGAYKGVFSVLLSVFNFVFAYLIYKRQETDKSLLFLLIGLVFTFITLAIPLQLEGNYITLFWAVESVLLLWLSQKSGFKIMQAGSVIVLLLMLISLGMDWSANYQIHYYLPEGKTPVYLGFLFNKMTITSLIAILSIWGNTVLLRNETHKIAWIIPSNTYKTLTYMALGILVFFAGFLEVQYQAHRFFSVYASKMASIITYTAIYTIALLIFTKRFQNKDLSSIIGLLSAAVLFFSLMTISFTHFKSIFSYLEQTEHYTGLLLLFRWTSVISSYIIAFMLFDMVKKQFQENKKLIKFSLVFLIFTIIYLLSADLDAIAVLIAKNRDILIHTQKTGYAVLWGISSFVLMMIGMKKKNQMIRIVSLVLFGITIIKLFVYDISNIPEGGKIAAFIFLGILLLIISFMYQKIKRLVIEDEAKNIDDSKA